MRSSAEDAAEALLRPWPGPYGGVPPFDIASPAAIEIAYRRAISEMEQEVDAIAAETAPPTFENTVAALENAGRALTRVEALLRIFSWTALGDAMSGVQQRLAPLRPALEDAISHNERLFARVQGVQESADLDGQQRRLADVLYRRMVRRGAGLDAARRAELADINCQLAALQTRFGQNLQADGDTDFVTIAGPHELAGLSDETIAAMAEEARRRGVAASHVVANQRGLFDIILSEARARSLRERVWRMWTGRGASTNPPIADEILHLRGRKARLLGFANYADHATSDRMAGSATRALTLVESIADRALAAANADLGKAEAFARGAGEQGALEPWDLPYWSAQMATDRTGFDPAGLTPYLLLDAMMAAIFWAAGELYALEFSRVDDVPVLHPDISVYEVKRSGTAVGLLYADLFSRPGKRGTAWMDEYRTAERFRGRVMPIASLNHCLTPATEGRPVLLSWDNARVLFHEMGHALHALLTDVDYPSLGIMNVAWDMIELPSQLFETLVATPEVLGRFARHHLTGDPMPPEWIDRIASPGNPGGAAAIAGQAASAIVDLKLHIAADGNAVDAAAVEVEALAALNLPRAIDPRHRVPHFLHSFVADSYAAGYYCYQWADVMAADASEIFSASSGAAFDKPTAERFRRSLLGVGSSVMAEQAYRDFAGRDPDPDALIRKLGLAA